MNLIIESTKQVSYYTDMQQTISALGISASDFDWFISDIEINCIVPTLQHCSDEPWNYLDQWVSVAILQSILENQDIQFIWAVFSAVPKGYRCHIAQAPYCEGNPDYWNKTELVPQLEGALFEIACWDSSATILIGISEALACQFINHFSDTKVLDRNYFNKR